jgi:hypothetical protein
MLPVLIEHELDAKVDSNRDPFFDTIRRHVEDMIGVPEPPDDALLEALLRNRRLLVIVDHLSEMNEATRERVRPDVPCFMAKALLVTSRRREELGGMSLTELQPMRVDAERLIDFMSAYLRECGVRDLFDDVQFIEACQRLKMLAGERAVTLLLVRLFADQLVEAKLDPKQRQLPENIPDLMLAYISRLNRTLPEGERRSIQDVYQDAKIVAWECVKGTLQPSDADYKVVLRALGKDAEAHLTYLGERLRLVEIRGVSEDRVRFQLDPLAEYLAALSLVERLGTGKGAWRQFLADLPSNASNADEFLLALRDCVNARPQNAIPSFVADALNRLTHRDETSPKDIDKPERAETADQRV